MAIEAFYLAPAAANDELAALALGEKPALQGDEARKLPACGPATAAR